VLRAARWKCRTQKLAKKSPSGNHRTTLSGHIFATKAHIDDRKKFLNSNISPTCCHNMVNFGPLAAEIGSLVWVTPANFNGFCVLTSLLQRRRSAEANRTLHDLWPSPGRGTRNGITELSQRTPPIFGWAAIILGIGPHSSSAYCTGDRKN